MSAALGAWLVLVALFWAGAFVEVRRRREDDTWRLRPEDPACEPSERVVIVIPARDEERGIGAAVASALAQDHANVAVRVLDDGSTDGTARVLAGFLDPRLTVLHGGDAPPPAGWLGKPWACRRAVEGAGEADWLLFVDADVVLAPEAVSRAVHRARARELGLLSGLGSQVTGTLGEDVIQSAVMAMILAGNPMDRVNDPANERPLAIGQFLLFRGDAYEAIGGHEAVRADVIDDIGLAIATRRGGFRTETVLMRRIFSVRMYTSGRDAWRGWRKNLFPGLARRWDVLFLLVAFQVAAILLPYGVAVAWAAGAVGPWPGGAAVAAVFAIQALRWHVDGVFGRDRVVGQLTHALGAALLVALAVDSAISTTLGWTSWKGRRLPAGREA